MDNLNLLLVEDDLPSLEMMTEVFASLNAEVRPVSDSQQAASLVNRERFDGIFLDLEMPKMHGLDLAKHVRTSSWNKSTPIVVVTGRDDKLAMQEAFANGATYFLHKPIDRQRLSKLLRTVRGGMFQNRRRYSRISFQAEVSITKAGSVTMVKSLNLSHGGIQLDHANLVQGDVVRMKFQMPHGGPLIDTIATVVWDDSGRQGMQFSKLSFQHETAIRDFISRSFE
ncbi:MAG TPA: response regulator [Terriglobales bacterium]|nr:response regulator [Terriglobales bacterium]